MKDNVRSEFIEHRIHSRGIGDVTNYDGDRKSREPRPQGDLGPLRSGQVSKSGKDAALPEVQRRASFQGAHGEQQGRASEEQEEGLGETIGKDPRTGGLRSWLFGSDGGFGEATWSRDGKRWLLEASGVTSDGDEMTATNILTPIDKDSFSWQSIDRTRDGEDLPNVAPIKVTRVK